MNEELRSTNEELETMNNELKSVSDELNHSNLFLHSILSSMTSIVVATNASFEIIAWNYRAQDVWGISEKEAIGCSLWDLDTGLPVHLLKAPLNKFKESAESTITIEIDGTSRRGKPVSAAVKVTRLSKLNGYGDGYLLMMDNQS
ncbi:MAG: PAS domain S-box protein, partial [Leptolyngbya sp.]|nr:PAS domain S-box protein [Candidatus Melainabacteria bacterium]